MLTIDEIKGALKAAGYKNSATSVAHESGTVCNLSGVVYMHRQCTDVEIVHEYKRVALCFSILIPEAKVYIKSVVVAPDRVEQFGDMLAEVDESLRLGIIRAVNDDKWECHIPAQSAGTFCR